MKEIAGKNKSRILFGSCCGGSEWWRNVPAYHGIRQVPAYAKGIFSGDIAPQSGLIMDGTIDFDDTVYMNSHLLDVLAIRHLIVGENTSVSDDLPIFGQVNSNKRRNR